MVPADEPDRSRSSARNRRSPVPLVRLDGRWWNRGELFPLPAADDTGGPQDLVRPTSAGIDAAAAPRIALRLPPQDDERGRSTLP
jgi:hypothetical protein